MDDQPAQAKTSQMTRQARNAYRIVVVGLLTSGMSASFYLYLAFTQGAWQFYAWSIDNWLLTLAVAISARLIRRGRLSQGMSLLLITVPIVFIVSVALIKGIGLPVGIGIMLLASIIGSQTLTARAAGRAALWGAASGAAAILLDILDPAYRLPTPESTRVFVPVIIGIVVLLSGAVTVRQFLNYTLRTKLLISFIAVTSVPLVILGVYTNLNARALLTANSTQALTAQAQLTALQLDTFFRNQTTAISVEAQQLAFREYFSIGPEQRAGSLTETASQAALSAFARKDTVFIISYALLDAQGNNLLDTQGSYKGRRESDFEYFKRTIAEGRIIFYGVSFDAKNHAQLYASSPVRDRNGAIIGVLRTEYNADLISSLVNSARSGGSDPGRYLSVIDKDTLMRVVDTASPDETYKTLRAFTPEQIASLQAQKRLPAGTPEEIIDSADRYEADLQTLGTSLEFKGSSTYLNGATINVGAPVNSMPWVVVVSQSETALFSTLDAQSNTLIIISLVLIALAALAARLLSQFLSKPIESLTTVAQRITAGDLSAHAAINTQDEIGALARVFNTMTAQLRGMVGSLETQVQARTEQLRASAAVGQAATSVLEPDRLLHEIVNLITERFGFYYAAVFTLDDTGRYAVLREATGKAGRTLKDRRHQLAVGGQSMVGYATAQRKARIALDVSQEVVRFANPLLPDTRSEIALPLAVGDRVLGALDVQSTQAAAFDEAGVAVLQSMADQIAVALSNAEQFQQTAEALKNTRRLFAASQEMSAALDADDLLHTLIRHITPDASRAAIALFGPPDETGQPAYYEFVATWVQADYAATRRVPPLPPGTRFTPHQLPAVSVFNEVTPAQPLVVPDVGADEVTPALCALLDSLGAAALIALALTAGQNRLGILIVGYRQARPFSADYLQTLVTLSSQAAIVIQNRRALAETQTALKQLNLVNRRLTGEAWRDYTASLGGALTIQDVVPDLQDKALPATLDAPIMVRGEPIGALQLDDVNPDRTWNAHDRTLLEAVANEVAVAIDNARLLEQVQLDAEREHSLSHIVTTISRAASMNDLMAMALELTLETIGFDCGLATLFDAATNTLRLLAQRNLPEPLSKRFKNSLKGTLCEYVFIQGEAFALEDLRQNAPLDVSSLLALGLQSYVGIPLTHQDRMLGTLCMFGYAPKRLSEKTDLLLQSIGQQISVGIHSARLLEQVQLDAEREHILNRIAGQLRNAQSVEQVLNIATHELRAATRSSVSLVEIAPASTGPLVPYKKPLNGQDHAA
jgi:GAF domain-containing protein/HAMP domain-containing protein